MTSTPTAASPSGTSGDAFAKSNQTQTHDATRQITNTNAPSHTIKRVYYQSVSGNSCALDQCRPVADS